MKYLQHGPGGQVWKIRPITGEHQATALVLAEKDIMKKNEIPPTRAWRSAPLALREGKPRPSIARVGGIYHTQDNLPETLRHT